MAKQNGLVKLLGTVGDMTYYKSKDGFMAKEKTSLNGERIASDPKFKRTRENMAEFGDAGKAGKTLRQSVNLLLQNAKDARVVSRLCKAMLAIVKTDKTNKRGMRTVALGDVTLLGGFEFNANAVLNTTLYAPFTTAIDRLTGRNGKAAASTETTGADQASQRSKYASCIASWRCVHGARYMPSHRSRAASSAAGSWSSVRRSQPSTTCVIADSVSGITSA